MNHLLQHIKSKCRNEILVSMQIQLTYIIRVDQNSEGIPYLLHSRGQFYKEQFQEDEGVLAPKASENWIFLFGILQTISFEQEVVD